jgi:SEC-C motif-containing protein
LNLLEQSFVANGIKIDDFLTIHEDWNSFNNAVSTNKNIGRNDFCPCGSGKKYKKCCGVNQ